MTIAKVNNHLWASIAMYLQEPQSLELVSKKFHEAIKWLFYPKLYTGYTNLAPLRTFVNGFVGPNDVRLRVCAISYRVIVQAKGIYLGDALLQSMRLSRTSILRPEQLLALCKWNTKQQDHNLLIFFQRVCDYSLAAKTLLLSLKGDEKEKAKQIRTWLEGNLPALKGIEMLDLYNLALTQLPDEIAHFPCLKQLYLNDNWLTALPEALGALKQLDTLSVDNNCLTCVPQALCEMPRLRELSLNDNRMSKIPPLVYTLSKLKLLHWNNNGLTELSPSISMMSGLVRLYLSNNALADLPSQIGDLPNLSMLYLDKNRLTYLSGDIARLSDLVWIVLDDNPIKAVSALLKKSSNRAISGNEAIKSAPSKK